MRISEIYEGDILRVCMGGDLQENPCVVEWGEYGWKPFEEGNSDGYYRITRCEVIGNIYDNPELVQMTGGKK